MSQDSCHWARALGFLLGMKACGCVALHKKWPSLIDKVSLAVGAMTPH